MITRRSLSRALLTTNIFICAYIQGMYFNPFSYFKNDSSWQQISKHQEQSTPQQSMLIPGHKSMRNDISSPYYFGCGPDGQEYDFTFHPTDNSRGAFTDLRKQRIYFFSYPQAMKSQSIDTQPVLLPSLHYNHDGSLLAFKDNGKGFVSNIVKICKPDEEKYLNLRVQEALYLAWHCSKNLLAIASFKTNEATVYTIEHDQPKGIYSVQNNNAVLSEHQLAWNPDPQANLLTTVPATDEKTVAFWDGANGKEIVAWKKDGVRYLNGIRWNSQGSLLAAAPTDHTDEIYILDRQGKKAHTVKTNYPDYCRTQAWKHDLLPIISAGKKTVMLWNSKAQKIQTSLAHDDYVIDAQLHPQDSNLITTLTERDFIHVWDTNGTLLNTITIENGENLKIEWNHEGSLLAWQGSSRNLPAIRFFTKKELLTQ